MGWGGGEDKTTTDQKKHILFLEHDETLLFCLLNFDNDHNDAYVKFLQ